jgi:hypothetical protein
MAQQKGVEFWVTVTGTIASAVFVALTYAHATFLPRNEADGRRDDQHRAEDRILKELDVLKQMLSELLMRERNEKSF